MQSNEVKNKKSLSKAPSSRPCSPVEGCSVTVPAVGPRPETSPPQTRILRHHVLFGLGGLMTGPDSTERPSGVFHLNSFPGRVSGVLLVFIKH